jgi:predicted kinase
MKRLILVNGVPASGKSTVAHAISNKGNWPLLALDTIKEALFAHLGTGDRDHNRLLGRASYQAMFALATDFPDGATLVMDAWFSFQPETVLASHLTLAGQPSVVQVWCHAPPAEIGRRYAERVAGRSGGHLGLDYVPELIALAERANPLKDYPAFDTDTTARFDLEGFMRWLESQC